MKLKYSILCTVLLLIFYAALLPIEAFLDAQISYSSTSHCVNGGVLADEKDPTGPCICPLAYTGLTCSERQCPNSYHGEGDFFIAPVNETTQYCDSCQEDSYQGINCQLCQKNEACKSKYGGGTSICDRGFAVQGNEKQFQCDLNAPYFLQLMGDGRNVSAQVLVNLTTTDGKSFGVKDNGLCFLTLYRQEPENIYIDPFFRCEASKCSYHFEEDTAGREEENASIGGVLLEVVRVGGQVLLLSLTVALVLLRCCSSILGPKRLKRFTVTISSLIVLSTICYILFMTMGLNLWHNGDKLVVFDCKRTHCECAEDPPEEFQPICSTSPVLSQTILPSIQNSIRFSCNDATGICKLSLDDLNIVFDTTCQASECLKESPVHPDHENDVAQKDGVSILQVLVYCVLIIAVLVSSHAFLLRLKSQQRRKEFAKIFHIRSFRTQSRGRRAAGRATAPTLPPSAPRINSSEPSEEDTDERAPLLAHRTSRSVGEDRGGESDDDDETSVMAAEDRQQVEEVRRIARSSVCLEAKELSYTLPVSRLGEELEERRILQRITFSAQSGEMVAIMGPSGAGKSTLLDLLSMRSKSGVVSGELRINGTPIVPVGPSVSGDTPPGATPTPASDAASLPPAIPSPSTKNFRNPYRNLIGYVSQEDSLLPALTVRQTITYAARLKLPSVFSVSMIHQIVSETITALKLNRCEHTLIGDGTTMRGVSGGERRRVSIAVELLANPRILLLDEPTSGLDSVSAQMVMEAVQAVAKHSPMRVYAPYYFAFQPIVIVSIHQPSVSIYNLFDKVLLLSQGFTVYSGPTNQAASLLLERMNEAYGYSKCDPQEMQGKNPAECLLQLENAIDDRVRVILQALASPTAEPEPPQRPALDVGSKKSAVQEREHSPTSSVLLGSGSSVRGEVLMKTTTELRRFYAHVYQQLNILISRSCASLLGSFNLIACHAGVVVCLSILLSTVYKAQSLDLAGALNRAGCISFLLLVIAFMSLSCLEALLVERRLFLEERENGFYSTVPYLVSKLAVDILPFRIMPAAVLGSIIYFPMGFREDEGWCFFYFISILVLFSIDITLLTLCIGIVSPSFGTAALLSSIWILLNFVFGGAMVQSGTLPVALKNLQQYSPFFLAFESLMVNELDGQACTFSPTDETGKPSATFNIMCRQYLSNEGLIPSRWSDDIILLCLYSIFFLLLASLLMSQFSKLIR